MKIILTNYPISAETKLYTHICVVVSVLVIVAIISIIVVISWWLKKKQF